MGAMSDFWNNVVAPAGASLAKSADAEVGALNKAGSALVNAEIADANAVVDTAGAAMAHFDAGIAEATGLGGAFDKLSGGDGTNQDLGRQMDLVDQDTAKAQRDALDADKKAAQALGGAVPGVPATIFDPSSVAADTTAPGPPADGGDPG
jgi:hypothetical protein